MVVRPQLVLTVRTVAQLAALLATPSRVFINDGTCFTDDHVMHEVDVALTVRTNDFDNDRLRAEEAVQGASVVTE